MPILAGLDQRVPPQRADGLLIGERGSDGYGEPLGQHIRMLSGEATGDILGVQEGAQYQQILGCRRLLAQPPK